MSHIQGERQLPVDFAGADYSVWAVRAVRQWCRGDRARVGDRSRHHHLAVFRRTREGIRQDGENRVVLSSDHRANGFR